MDRPIENTTCSNTTENKEKKLTGFALNPDNINRNGRPRKGMAWKDVVIDMGDDEMKDGKTRKEEIVAKVYKEANKGNMDAIKLLWNSLVGTKTQNEISGADGKELVIKVIDYDNKENDISDLKGD